MAVRALTMGVTRFRAAIADALEISPTDVLALTEIALHPDLTPGELADRIAVGIAGTSAVIDRLVTAGFARRVPSSTDRRTYNLTLSPAGVHAGGWITDATRTVITDAQTDLAVGVAGDAGNLAAAGSTPVTQAPPTGLDRNRAQDGNGGADATVMHLNALSAAYYRHADTVNAR